MRKKLLFLIPVALLALALPVVMFLTREQQDTRSRASSTNDIIFSFHPSTSSVAPSADLNVDVMINTNNKPVNAIEFKVTFDKDLLTLEDVTNGTAFNDALELEPNNTTGVYRYAGTSNTDVTGGSVKVLTLNFKTKTPTTSNNVAEVGFTEMKAGAAGEDAPITHTTSFTAGTLTVEAANACLSENSKPLSCTCGDDTECESGACEAGFCVAGLPGQSCETMENGKPDGCACEEDEDCASNVCGDEDKCELAPDPTATPTLTPTVSPTPTTAVIPTATLIPTPTIDPNAPRINFTVILPGIGDAPIHPQILGPYNMYDASNTLALNGSVLLTRDASAGVDLFKGTASISDGVNIDTTKSYNILLKTDNTLSKRSEGIVTFSGTPQVANASFTMVFGDVNDDNELSILDYSLLIECIQKNICLETDGKKRADFTDDGKVDALDLNILYTGFARRIGE